MKIIRVVILSVLVIFAVSTVYAGDGSLLSLTDTAGYPQESIAQCTAQRAIFIPGDVNDDGSVNIADVVAFSSYFWNNGPMINLYAADVNMSGSVDIADFVYFTQWQFNNGPAPRVAANYSSCIDLDCDGVLTTADAKLMFTSADCGSRCDFNGDGKVNVSDIVLFAAYITGKSIVVPPKCAVETVSTYFACADPNNDQNTDETDIQYLTNYIFKGGPAPVNGIYSGDANGDGSINIADVVYLVNYILKNGPEPVCSDPANPASVGIIYKSIK